jgi:hypothetical protein
MLKRWEGKGSPFTNSEAIGGGNVKPEQNPYGDGKAAEKIVDTIHKVLTVS